MGKKSSNRQMHLESHACGDASGTARGSTDNQHQAREVMCIQQHLLPECKLWCYPLRRLFTVTGIDTLCLTQTCKKDCRPLLLNIQHTLGLV